MQGISFGMSDTNNKIEKSNKVGFIGRSDRGGENGDERLKMITKDERKQ